MTPEAPPPEEAVAPASSPAQVHTAESNTSSDASCTLQLQEQTQLCEALHGYLADMTQCPGPVPQSTWHVTGYVTWVLCSPPVLFELHGFTCSFAWQVAEAYKQLCRGMVPYLQPVWALVAEVKCALAQRSVISFQPHNQQSSDTNTLLPLPPPPPPKNHTHHPSNVPLYISSCPHSPILSYPIS